MSLQRVCFIGCYHDWFMEGDLDQVELYAVTIGEFPDVVADRFKRHVQIDMIDFGKKSSEWHLSEKSPSLYHYLCGYIPDCDHYYSFKTVIRVDGDTIKHLEVTSDKYCGGGVDASSPWSTYNLNHIFSGKVQHIDTMSLNRSIRTLRIVVPSTIYTSDNTIDNTMNRRSIFTGEERYDQLLSQLRDLDTLKKVLPPFEVYILEGSRPHLHQLRQLSRYGTVVLFYETKGEYYASEHPNKSYFEFYSIYRILRLIRNYKWFVKFGARYRPIGDPITPLLGTMPVAKIIQGKYTYTGNPIMNSVLFSYPSSFVGDLLQRLRHVLSSDTSPESSESVFLHKSAVHVPQLSVYGWDGIYSCVQVE